MLGRENKIGVEMRPNCSHLSFEKQDLISRYCQGNGIDVGCGYSKLGACVGIDKIPYGQLINIKDETKKVSQAEWAFDAGSLPLKDNTMDFVYSSHAIEHITPNVTSDKTELVIKEWIRVLKPGGYLLMIIPDINHCIPPIAKRKGLKIFHGLEPIEVKKVITDLDSVKVIKFNTLTNINEFEVVVQKR